MNNKTYIDILKYYSQQFRIGIIRTDRTLLPVTFNNFPRGACGDSSWLLGRYLQENGIEGVEYVCGVKGFYENQVYREQSHAWLEKNGIIIDITSDQFDEVTEEVVVTIDHSWHSQFEEEKRMVADYRVYDSFITNILNKAYIEICKNVSGNNY